MAPPPRAYDPNADRLLRRGTLVFSLADIRRNIALRLADGAPCNLVLASDVVVDGTLVVPAALSSFSLDGGDRFKLIVKGVLGRLIECGASPTRLSNLTIQLAAGAVVTTAFLASGLSSGAPLLLDNVNFDASQGTLTNLFAHPSPSFAGQSVIASRGTYGPVARVFAHDGFLGLWQACNLADLDIRGPSIGVNATVGGGATDAIFTDCTFERIRGPLTISLGATSTKCVFTALRDSSNASTFNSNGIGVGNDGNLVEACAGYTLTTSPSDVFLLSSAAAAVDINGAIATRPKAVSLSTAGPTLTPGNSSFIRVTHAVGSSGNVTVAAGVDGQRLTLFFVSYAGTAVYTTGAGNLRIAASPFTPTAKDILELIYDATTAEWIETGRSVNV